MRKSKENIYSETESMLVSQRRPLETIKNSNIQNIQMKCECLHTLRTIENKLQLFQLRLDEISANINICFTKHMQCYGKLVDEQKKRENVEYIIWETKQLNQAIHDKINIQITKQQQTITNLNQQVQSWARVLRDMKNWKTNYSSWSSNFEKNMVDIYKGYKQDNDEKLKKMYQAIEQIGLLQRKMLERSEHLPPEKKSRPSSTYCERQSFQSKKGNPSQNETTMLFSRNYIK